MGSALLSPVARLQEIAQHIRTGNKIEAIRIYQEAFNVSLTEAKNAVEALTAGRPVLMPGSAAIGSANANVASNPSVTTTFTPQAFSTSSRGTTYTLGGSIPNTPFIVHWIRFSLAAIPVPFVLALLALVFPNLSRLAAPVLCPANYRDAYGEVTSSSDSDGTGYNVEMSCVDAEGQVTQPNGLLVAAVIYGLYLGAGILFALGLAALLRFKLAGCLPLLAILVIVPVSCFAYVSLIPSRSGNSFLQLFGLDLSQGVTLPGIEVFNTPVPILDSSPTPSIAVQLWASGSGSGTGPGQFNDTRTVAVDGAGNVYTADYSDGRIQVFDSKGNFFTRWNISGDNVYISGLAADSTGTLYIVYGGNVNRFNGLTGEPLGKLPYAGSYLDDVAVAPSGEIVALSDTEIARFEANGNLIATVSNWGASLEGTFPAGADNLAIDPRGNIYIADFTNSAIYIISADGQSVGRFKSQTMAAGPRALGIDSQGRLYIHNDGGIQVFSDDGALSGVISVEGVGFDLAISAQDEVLFMDRNANKIFKYKMP